MRKKYLTGETPRHGDIVMVQLPFGATQQGTVVSIECDRVTMRSTIGTISYPTENVELIENSSQQSDRAVEAVMAIAREERAKSKRAEAYYGIN